MPVRMAMAAAIPVFAFQGGSEVAGAERTRGIHVGETHAELS
jgi:hypothetical protein